MISSRVGGFGSLLDSAKLWRLCVKLALLLLRLGLLIVVKLGAAESVDEDDRRSLVDLILPLFLQYGMIGFVYRFCTILDVEAISIGVSCCLCVAINRLFSCVLIKILV